jgi:hypothetical protein
MLPGFAVLLLAEKSTVLLWQSLVLFIFKQQLPQVLNINNILIYSYISDERRKKSLRLHISNDDDFKDVISKGDNAKMNYVVCL